MASMARSTTNQQRAKSGDSCQRCTSKKLRCGSGFKPGHPCEHCRTSNSTCLPKIPRSGNTGRISKSAYQQLKVDNQIIKHCFQQLCTKFHQYEHLWTHDGTLDINAMAQEFNVDYQQFTTPEESPENSTVINQPAAQPTFTQLDLPQQPNNAAFNAAFDATLDLTTLPASTVQQQPPAPQLPVDFTTLPAPIVQQQQPLAPQLAVDLNGGNLQPYLGNFDLGLQFQPLPAFQPALNAFNPPAPAPNNQFSTAENYNYVPELADNTGLTSAPKLQPAIDLPVRPIQQGDSAENPFNIDDTIGSEQPQTLLSNKELDFSQFDFNEFDYGFPADFDLNEYVNVSLPEVQTLGA